MAKKTRERKPTRNEKEQIKKMGLDWKNWLVSEIPDGSKRIVSKKSGLSRVLKE